MQRQTQREVYDHKFTMKEDALKVAVKQRPGSPRLITNKKDFDRAVKDYIMKNIEGEGIPPPGLVGLKFDRKTRMGGHLSTILKKAGLSNAGLQG